MNVLKNLNDAMAYIEENIEDEIDFQRVSQIACCSEYHFRRMFSFMSGMSLGEYIRNRRMTLAAIKIKNTDKTIIDIAIHYGYESPDAFTKTFRNFHGFTPIKLKNADISFKTFLPMTFQLSIRGGIKMDYRIIEKDAFHIIGVSGRIPLIYRGPNPHVAEVWGKLNQENLLVLQEYSEIDPKGIISVYTNYEDKHAEGTMLDLYVGITSLNFLPERLMKRFDILSVETSKWVVFNTCGTFPDSIQEVWSQIYNWFLSIEDYERIDGPEISWYESYDFEKPDFKSEIWIPIKLR